VLDLTFSTEIIDIGWGPVSLTKFSDSRIQHIKTFSQYFYIDPTQDYFYIYFELFNLYRCVLKYLYYDDQLDIEIINNTDHEVLLKTDDLDFAIEKIEELYMNNIRNNLIDGSTNSI